MDATPVPVIFIVFLAALVVSVLLILKPEAFWKRKVHLIFKEPTPFILMLYRLSGVIYLAADLALLYLMFHAF